MVLHIINRGSTEGAESRLYVSKKKESCQIW
jgi:hypothetical protein